MRAIKTSHSRKLGSLQRCINDLISLQALPAVWNGVDAGQVLSSLLDALVCLLRLDFCAVRVQDYAGGPPMEIVRLKEEGNPNTDAHQLSALKAWFQNYRRRKAFVTSVTIRGKDLDIVQCRLGLQHEIGFVVAGSTRTDFPTKLETILLKVAANQAVIGLEEARALNKTKERLRRSEAELEEDQRLSHTGTWG